jgi:DNA-binding MarR family transcriptional regulator
VSLRAGELLLLARVRRGLRALTNAITRGADEAGLTLQQQAFLLAIEAYGGSHVQFADVREELEMDRATASILLGKLVEMGLVSRIAADDRRASQVSLTARGRNVFLRSVRSIRREIQAAEHRDELLALRQDLAAYLGYYVPEVRRRATATAPRPAASRLSARAAARAAGRRRC